jgi:hypothetical protein
MSERPATRKEMIAIGIGVTAVGLYFMLVGANVLPIPGGPKNLHAPLWVVVCAGLVFFLGGASVLIGGIRANAKGEVPKDTPGWLAVVHYLVGLAIFGSFAAMTSWVAFGPGPRQFSGSLTGLESSVGAGIGRTVFGIGAAFMWLATIVIAVSGVRKLRGQSKAPTAP